MSLKAFSTTRRLALALAATIGGLSSIMADESSCVAAKGYRHPLFNSVAAARDLFVSEPNPRMFGNAGDTPDALGWTNGKWLKSRFHFSFAEYRNLANSNFGVLRVCNDDLVQPARGFATHGHGDMEIVTLILSGDLTHADSMGTAETLTRGDIQFMTAGTGVRHSEHNNAPAAPLRFIQMWLTPRTRGLRPNYGSARGDPTARRDRFAHLVGDVAAAAAAEGEGPAVRINADANIFVVEFTAEGKSARFAVAAGRQAYLLVLEGGISVAGAHGEGGPAALLRRHDAAEVFGANDLTVTATGAEASAEIPGDGAAGMVLLVEMALDGHSRFR